MMLSPDARQFRVVVADDVSQVRFVLIRALERTGRFRVVAEAADGDQALGSVIAYQPDAIILDLSMPNRGGLDILPELRQVAPSTVVAVYSSVGPDVLGKVVWQAGAHLYCQKEGAIGEFVSDLMTEMEVQRTSREPIGNLRTGGRIEAS